ncbi:MAG: ester cyclase [Methanoregula sp.]
MMCSTGNFSGKIFKISREKPQALCRAAFHGLHVTIDEIVADGNTVIARFTACGTHNGEFMSVPPTGKAITLMAIEIFRGKDGKIVGLWGEVTMKGLLQLQGDVARFSIIIRHRRKLRQTG